MLAHARPTAVNLGYGVRRAADAYRRAVKEGADQGRAAAAALAEARALHREDAEASARMAEHGLALLGELLPGGGHRILTHCNTGALVSGGDGTAFAVARAVHRIGELRRLWVDETRPLLQGARLTAYEAARGGMAYTLLTDNAAGSLFAAGEVDAVLIGADRIAADGSVANKVGSYPLAVLARYHHVPFIVVAPTTTVDLETPDGASIEVEQRPGHEVTELAAPSVPVAGAESGAGIPVAPLGTQAYNPAFDVTPPELVTAIVTESGVLSPVTRVGLAELCARSRQVTMS
jgi:methylthioribose-1-phosphate isomerase